MEGTTIKSSEEADIDKIGIASSPNFCHGSF
jgi:hypothetical protein